MIKDDTLWKGIIENVFDDFLRFFFVDADKLFDFEKGFQFMDKELEQLFPTETSEAPKFVDKLVKVFNKDGAEEWILVHIEVQGYDDPEFSKRMFTYFYRILDRYGKPVTAIAIFTDNNKNFHPKFYSYDHLGTKNTYIFNTYKVLEQDENILAKDKNPFAIVLLTVLLALKKKKLDDETLLQLKLEIFRNLYRRNVDKEKMRGLAAFLKLYVHFASPETNIKFEQTINVITKNKNTMGIIEMVLERTEKKGRDEAKTEIIKKLITKMGLSDEQIADIADTPLNFVIQIRKEMNNPQ